MNGKSKLVLNGFAALLLVSTTIITCGTAHANPNSPVSPNYNVYAGGTYNINSNKGTSPNYNPNYNPNAGNTYGNPNQSYNPHYNYDASASYKYNPYM